MRVVGQSFVTRWMAPGITLFVKDCLAAVDKIRNDDILELMELWEESGDPPRREHAHALILVWMKK